MADISKRLDKAEKYLQRGSPMLPWMNILRFSMMIPGMIRSGRLRLTSAWPWVAGRKRLPC